MSIDGFSSKCWSILIYPKCHEPSLDICSTNRFDTLVILFWRHILLVVWKCLILCQISSFAESVDSLLSFKENGGWNASRAPKSLRRCCSKWNNVSWLVPSLQRRWFRCWRPSAWRKAKNLRRRWIGGTARWGSVPNARRACFSIRSYSLSHFQAIACVGNDSKTRNLGSLWLEAKGRWVSYLRLWTTVSAAKEGCDEENILHRITMGDEKWIHYSSPKKRKSWGLPGYASTSSARPNIHAAKVMLCIWWDQVGVIYYELLEPNETITGERYRTQLMRLSRALCKSGHNTSRGTKKWSYRMKTLGLTLLNLLKPRWKCSNGKSYPTRRIFQILRRPIITCSVRWHMVWLISSSAHMKTSKNVLIHG